ncbi:hypothetical protein JG688_00015713 [Phytophthora aleatoria]|uniref:DDE-1 domain-containing protein n=1 Tax=Phytophthora aleatoria TaxID=2496075 RepID=A0A8J5I9M9_9STRA|nr:hypothetical protein JG688_00015713 [Phytophthora aleatoria]
MRTFKLRCRRVNVNHHIEHDFPESTIARRFLITQVVVLAWESIDDELIARGFLKAGLVPVGPREADGAFRLPKPSNEPSDVAEAAIETESEFKRLHLN